MKLIEAIYDESIITPILLEDEYIARFYTADQQRVLTPVDFRLREGITQLPLTDSDIYYIYSENISTVNSIKGEIKTNAFYPKGQSLKIYAHELKVVGYLGIVVENGVQVLNVLTESLGMIEVAPGIDRSKDAIVKNEVSTILRINEYLRDLLPQYEYNWLNYTEENVFKYIQYQEVLRLLRHDESEKLELRYLIDDLVSGVNNNMSLSMLTQKIMGLSSRFNSESLKIKYYDTEIQTSISSFIYWILSDIAGDIKLTKLLIEDINPAEYASTSINIIRNSGEITIEFTPAIGGYNYIIDIPSMDIVEVDNTYNNILIDGVSLTKVYKSDPANIQNIDLVGDTNMDKLVSAISVVKRLL